MTCHISSANQNTMRPREHDLDTSEVLVERALSRQPERSPFVDISAVTQLSLTCPRPSDRLIDSRPDWNHRTRFGQVTIRMQSVWNTSCCKYDYRPIYSIWHLSHHEKGCDARCKQERCFVQYYHWAKRGWRSRFEALIVLGDDVYRK